ncbi:MAG TPA: sugar phosphate isomerase/epimerase family protein [Pirellulales bacterium]|jgi:sugar phosphate isomerase/epimerase|nr:sugar phosphate isomerase/epimerase family protein [Pirellulales bacterium]
MPAINVAVQTRSVGLPLKRLLPLARQWGACAVELDGRGEAKPNELSQTGRRQLRKLFDDYELRVAAIGFRTRRGYDVTDDLERRVEATKAAMTLAYELGASWVVNQVGRVPEKPEGPRWQTLVEVLTDLGNYGQRAGALLAAETGSESPDDLARLLGALPRGVTGVCFNPGLLIINGFSPLDAVAALGSSVSYVHAQDGVRDLAQGRGIEVQLGRGSADFPALLGALEEHDYRGYWTIQREKSDRPVSEIADAASYLKSL